jgi:hypothetical protein
MMTPPKISTAASLAALLASIQQQVLLRLQVQLQVLLGYPFQRQQLMGLLLVVVLQMAQAPQIVEKTVA